MEAIHENTHLDFPELYTVMGDKLLYEEHNEAKTKRQSLLLQLCIRKETSVDNWRI